MRKTQFLLGAGAMALLSGLGFAGVALADDAQAQAGPPSAQVAEVIVTAEKREENVNEVPMSIDVVGRAQLKAYEVHDVVGLANSIPSFTIEASPITNGLYLRGFGSSPANPGLDQTVSVFEDGIYMGLAPQLMAPFFDVERIEVLRGPQGALVGRNTAAGALNIVTAGPTSSFDASVTGAYDISRRGFEIDGYVSGPITSDLSARLAVQMSDLGGYVRNYGTNEDEPDEKNEFVRGSLRYAPSDNLEVTTKLEYGNLNVSGSPAVLVSAFVPEQPPSTKDAVDGFNMYPFTGEYTKQTGYNSSTIASWKLDGFTLQSITGFSGFSYVKNAFAAPLNPEHYDILWSQNFNQQSEELRLLSPIGGAVDYIIGAYADHSSHAFNSGTRYDVFGIFNAETQGSLPQEENTSSVYGSATWHVTRALRITANLRYTQIHKSASSSEVLDFGIPLLPIVSIPTQTINEGHFDPAVTIQYDVRPGTMVYFSYAQGSLAGGFGSGITASTFVVKPETSVNYEVGLKSELFEHRLQATLSAYILKFQDLQVASYDPALLQLITTNAASATSEGVEGTFTWLVTRHLSLSGNGAYDHAVYDNYPGAQCNGLEPPTCVPATNNIAGFPLNFVPVWSGTLQGDYTAPLSDSLTLTLSAAAHYRSAYWIDGNNYDPAFGLQNPSVKVDARVQVGDPAGRWTLALIGKNLNNDVTRSYAYIWPLEPGPGGLPRAVADRDIGREVLLQVSGRFR